VSIELGIEELEVLVKTRKYRERDGNGIHCITKADDFAVLIDELLGRVHGSQLCSRELQDIGFYSDCELNVGVKEA
jgi:hypothetical protein